MPADAPRRRSGDDRRRWNDQALDVQADIIRDLGRDMAELHGVPERIDGLAQQLQASDEREGRRVKALHDKLEQLREDLAREIRDECGKVGEQLAAQPSAITKIDWKTVGVIVTAVVAPIVAAILGTGGGP